MECRGLTCLTSVVRSSAMLSKVFIHLLIASVAFGAAVQFNDETCIPRPQVVKLKDDYGNAVQPYHILLYRCMGTCDKKSPEIKPCTAGSTKEIKVSAQTAAGVNINVNVVNHTSCSCSCEVHCNYGKGEELDDENCKCTTNPNIGSVGARKPSEKSDSLPFMIGMALVGFFAVCVLVFDAMMCAKGFGVMHSIKTGCCSRGEGRSQCNGCANSPKHDTAHEITTL